MGDTPSPPVRKRTRLADFDYGRGNSYFVTLCIAQRLPLLGTIHNGKLLPSAAGEMIARLWQEMPDKYPGVVLDVFAVMPDHFHGILGLIDQKFGPTQGSAPTATPSSLPELMRRFKEYSQHEYGTGVRTHGWPQFNQHLWQRSYYDHVIRCESDLHACREYVYSNALAWEFEHRSA